MNRIAHYAIGLLAEGGESTAEDDMAESDEAEKLTEKEWRDGCDLGVKMAQAVGKHRDSFLAWYRTVEPTGVAADG